MDLNLLVVLRALLQERSVSRAAKALGLSQSATSHALSRLRELVGDPLLVRSGRGVVPTPRAERMASQLDAGLLQLHSALTDAAAFDPKRARLSFRFATSDYAEFLLVPALGAALTKQAPGISLWARLQGENAMTELVHGDVDALIGIVPPAPPPGVLHAPLLRDRFVCVMRRGHPLLKGKLTLERFAAAHHAFVAPGGKPGGVTDSALAARGHSRHVAVAVPHFLVAPHVVAQTDLVLTVASRIAHAYATLLPLEIVSSPLDLPGFELSMMWHARTDRDPAHRWIRDQFLAVANAQSASSFTRKSRGTAPRQAPSSSRSSRSRRPTPSLRRQ